MSVVAMSSYLVSNVHSAMSSCLVLESVVPYHHVLCQMSICSRLVLDVNSATSSCLVSDVSNAMSACLCRQGGEEGEGETKECQVFWQRIRPKGRVTHSYTTQCTHAPHSALMHHTVHSCTTQCTHATHSALMHHTVHSYTTQCTHTPQYL